MTENAHEPDHNPIDRIGRLQRMVRVPAHV